MSTIICDSKAKKGFSKDSPFCGKIKERFILNKDGSSKKTYHLSIDISSSDIEYEEGDAIAILPSNAPSLVNELLTLIKAEPTLPILDPRDKSDESSKKTIFLFDYLLHKANLSKITPSLLKLVNKHVEEKLDQLFFDNLLQDENKEIRANFISSHDVITLLKRYRCEALSAQEFIESLAPMLPRFYSIASSYQKYPNELHLLVGTFSFLIQQELRAGVGSEFLCSIAQDETQIPLYIHKNPNFKLPQDSTTPIIMIGAGTGLAPYKGFLEKRAFDPSSKNWLIFGEREKKHDFYYEDFLTELEQEKLLKLSLAFSRDQKEKVYIQHKLYEEKQTLWDWINQGAYIYLCGDAKQMAKDVSETLITIISEMSSTSLDEAKAFLQELKKAKRFQLDVY